MQMHVVMISFLGESDDWRNSSLTSASKYFIAMCLQTNAVHKSQLSKHDYGHNEWIPLVPTTIHESCPVIHSCNKYALCKQTWHRTHFVHDIYMTSSGLNANALNQHRRIS